MQFILELLLLPIFEFMFYGIGYVTAWIVVPLFTFGHVTVDPARDGKLLPKRGRRSSGGPYVIEAELASVIGVLFWIMVAVGVYFFQRPC